MKARFQNVFDVGGFYVECESEKPSNSYDDSSVIYQSSSSLPSTSSSAIIESNQQKKNVDNRIKVPTELNSKFQECVQIEEGSNSVEINREQEKEKEIGEVEVGEKATVRAVRLRTLARTLRRSQRMSSRSEGTAEDQIVISTE